MKQRAFLGYWAMGNGIAESLGLGTTFVLGLAVAPHLGDQTLRGALLTAAIAVLLGILLEGVTVGLAQGLVLRRRTRLVSVPSWVVATSIGAGVAWLLGMIPSTVIALTQGPSRAEPAAQPGQVVQWALAVVLGLVTGPVLGVAQWTVLRRHFRKAGQWLWANGAAWAVGMPAIFVGMDLVPWEAQSAHRILAIYTVCLVVGLIVGAIHGGFLLRITRPDQRVATEG